MGRMIRLATMAGVALMPIAAADDAGEAEASMPLVLEEDFESGADRWAPTDPEAWQVIAEDGNHVYALTQQSAYEPAVRSPFNIAWVKDLDVTDFRMELRFKQTGREYGHRDLCLFFGKQSDSRFYYVHFAPQADPHANSIFLVNDEPRVSIASERTEGTRWQDDVYHTARINRDTKTGRITVYFDDMETPAMVAEDLTFTSGTIGIGSFDDTGCFDDIRVWGIAAEKTEAEAEAEE